MVSKKMLIEIASNPDIMVYLKEIASINSNMCHKTIYEQKTARNKMNKYAGYIIDELKGVND